MNASLQGLASDTHIPADRSPPDFRFTNYPYAQQNLVGPSLPQGPLAPSEKSLIELFLERSLLADISPHGKLAKT